MLNKSNKSKSVSKLNHLKSVIPIIFLALLIAVTGIGTELIPNKHDIKANLSSGNQSTTTFGNPYDIVTKSGCPVHLNIQIDSQKLYDGVCKLIAEGKLHYPPTYPEGDNHGSLTPPPVTTTTSAITPIVAGGFSAVACQAFEPMGISHILISDNIEISTSPNGAFQTYNDVVAGEFLCAYPG